MTFFSCFKSVWGARHDNRRHKPEGSWHRCAVSGKNAEKAEAIGVQKTKLNILSLLALAIFAGAFIALGAMSATTVLAGADGVLPFG